MQLDKGQAELAAALAEITTERRHDQVRIQELEGAYATLKSASEQKEQAIEQLTQQLASQSTKET
ncbi:MAG: hypothetical protein AB2809_13505 [Candidatus Thiodiazotropha sp.]